MSGDFISFARAHGVLIDRLVETGKLTRCATEAHPKKKNGAYGFDGTFGWVKAYDGDGDTHHYKDARVADPAQIRAARDRARRQAELLRQEREQLRVSAAQRAARMLSESRRATHNYLALKGFPELQALVWRDPKDSADVLLVPMRELSTNALLGVQRVRWLPDEMAWEKKYSYGMDPLGAALRLGSPDAREVCLCEGYATGLSIATAVRQMRLSVAVVVTFSAHNLTHVAGVLGGRRYVIGDHDAPQRDPEKARRNPGCAGQLAAAATGLPWAVPEAEGMDANDLHLKSGLAAVCGLVMAARRAEARPFVVPPVGDVGAR